MNSKMNIKLTDTDKLTEALAEVQKRSQVRTITVEHIKRMCDKVFEKCGITKKAMEGVSFNADYHAQNFPSAYGYTPMSTHISAVYKRGEWRITNIERWETRRYNDCYRVNLTDAAREAILYRHAHYA